MTVHWSAALVTTLPAEWTRVNPLLGKPQWRQFTWQDFCDASGRVPVSVKEAATLKAFLCPSPSQIRDWTNSLDVQDPELIPSSCPWRDAALDVLPEVLACVGVMFSRALDVCESCFLASRSLSMVSLVRVITSAQRSAPAVTLTPHSHHLAHMP
ncbi:hypothetical protein GWK47_034149 [Chionoecetes opilio]|uniref:Uncharacterized protein n=1 Tax=Chionoecetes opilio TaxID=41210 RepID=A0A8J4YV04_CHIOP|nr:hypothetical protein GWK47_034149 [Chionoecetes opilio]